MEQIWASACEAITGLLPAAAVGALDAAEQVGVIEHLPHCTACQATLEAYESLLVQLAYAVPVVEPPERLRVRLMSMIAARWQPPDLATTG